MDTLNSKACTLPSAGTDTDATQMLGGPTKFRRFSRKFEEYAEQADRPRCEDVARLSYVQCE